MGENEISIRYDELTRLEVYCPFCGVGLLIDMANKKLPSLEGDGREDTGLGRQCPACRKLFPEPTLSVLMLYQKFQREASKANLDFQFRVKNPT